MGLLFNPNGRISKGQYWVGAIIVSLMSALLWVLSAYVWAFFFIFGFIHWWPWIAVHVKRFHDANLSGWITAAIAIGSTVVWFIISNIVSIFLSNPEKILELNEQVQESAQNEDLGAMFGALQQMFALQLPATLVTLAILTGLVGLVMTLLKSDPNANDYGPPTNGPQADTFS